MLKDKETRKRIITSLVASTIFFVCLRPILEFLWKIIVDISVNTYTGYIDGLYRNAALGQRDWIAFLIWSFILLVTFFSMISAINIINAKYRMYTETHHEEITNSEVSLEKLKEKIEKAKHKANKLKKVVRLFLKIRYIYISLGALTFLSALTSAYSDLQLNTSFQQRLSVIAPYIDDQTEDVLKSKWAMMKSRHDYDLINSEIESIARLNKIELPRKLLE